MNSFKGTLKDWESNPEFYNLTLREVERRRNQIQVLNNMVQDIKSKAFDDGTSLSKEKEQLFKDRDAGLNAKGGKMTVEETITQQKMALKSIYNHNIIK